MTDNGFDRPLMLLFMYIGKLLNDELRASLGEGGIHFGQARILVALLENDELNQGEISSKLHIKPPTVTNLVKKLEASGLIERQQDQNDDRIMNVTLTTSGWEAANFAVSVMAQIETDLCSNLSQDEMNALRKPLGKIIDGLGGPDPRELL